MCFSPPCLPVLIPLLHRRCSTSSSSKPCWSTTCTVTRSWRSHLWSPTWPSCTLLAPVRAVGAWRLNLRSVLLLASSSVTADVCVSCGSHNFFSGQLSVKLSPIGIIIHPVLWRSIIVADASLTPKRSPASQKLTSVKIQNDKMRTGNLPANMKKNRVLQIIPCESASGRGLGDLAHQSTCD